MKFLKHKLGDLGKIITGKTPSTSNLALWNGDIQFVTPEDLQRGKNILQTERHLTQEGVKSVCGAFIPAESVCVSCIGNIGYVAKTIYPCVTNQQINTIVPSNAQSPDFLYYKLKSIRNYFKLREGNATTIPILSKSDFANIAIHLPDLPTQLRIAAILGSIDEKIELNRKKIAELEALAKTIYDYWFVQFDFPDKNGKPYKSSGGKMTWNEQLKREIPDGWEIGNLYDIANFENGLACQKFRPKDNEASLPVIKIREMHDGINSDTERVSINIPEKHRITDGDLLFSWSASLEAMIWSGGVGGLNQHIFKVTPRGEYTVEYVYWQLKTYIVTFAKMAEARKTTMGHITADHIKQSRVILPISEILSHFATIIRPIFGNRINLKKEIRMLVEQRDTLLPLLMNGQVEVK